MFDANVDGVRARTYSLALRMIRLVRTVNRDAVGAILWRQLIRSGTSVGANVEEAQAAQSRKDFAHKMAIARKEAHETHYWLRLFRDAEMVKAAAISDLIDECEQLVRMLTSIVKTAQQDNRS